MPQGRVRMLLRENGLLLACLGLFGVFFIGMVISGAATYNQEQLEHGSHEQVTVISYLTTGDFVEAMFENWESEFLQMGMYVVLTAFLYQKGSSESKPLHVAGAQGRLGTADLRTLVGDRVLRVVLRVVRAARDGRCQGVQRRAAATRRGRDLGLALPDYRAVLVRVDAELAE